MKHFDAHNILTSQQHGFRAAHSCETQLIQTIHDFATSRNNLTQTDVIIIHGFSKAFDCVPHNRLLLKLGQYGVGGKVNGWLSGFLKDRKQRVVVGGDHSNWASVDSGVPQGTVLGPLLFLAYINDLPEDLHCSVRLFADDCVIYKNINCTQDAELLQTDLESLSAWEKHWQMHFNLYVPTCIHLFPHARTDTIQVVEHEPNLISLNFTHLPFLSWSHSSAH